MTATASRPNCYACRFRREVPGSAHSKCAHPKTAGVHANPTSGLVSLLGKRTGLTSMPLTTDAASLNVSGVDHGIRHGWFLWPVNYDPTWLERCDGFEALAPATTEATR